MRLSHSISMTLLGTLLTALSGCSSEEPGDGGGTSGTGGTAGAGTSGSGGTAGAGVSGSGGTAGAGVSGSGGTAGAGMSGSGGGAVDHPTDQSQAGIEAYLAAEMYKVAGNGWFPETMAGDPTSIPHLATRRYFNSTIIASKAAGNRTPTMQHTAGSMSIKEILEGTTVVGKAATLRTDASTWIYYCKATPGSRCGTGVADDTAYYATAAGPCNCHGSGTNISHDVIPAPQ